jgi:Tol biopolymer transport system component
VLSDEKQNGFMRGYWLSGAQRVIGVFDEKGKTRYLYYDYETGEEVAIGTAIAAFAVSPDGRRIAYTEQADGLTTLTMAAADGSAAVPVLNTRASQIQLSWPRGSDRVFMASRRSDHAGWDLTSVGLNGELATVISNRENLEYTWSPDGLNLLYSYFVPETGISLFWKDRTTGTDLQLGTATSARKCAWTHDSSSVVCGLPSRTPLARDVAADRMATTDDIVRIDLLTGSSTTLFKVPAGTLMGVIDPLVTPSDHFLAFQNIFDKRLYIFDLR